MDAAALCALFQCLVCMSVLVLLLILPTSCPSGIYRRQELLKIGVCCEGSVSLEFLSSHNIPTDIAKSPGSPWIIIPAGRWWRQRREETKVKLQTRALVGWACKAICQWIKDIVSDRTQRIRVGPHFSTPITLSSGSPQGCVLSPLLCPVVNDPPDMLLI